MYLKRLELQGFKSFADKVEFTFSPGVTAIVGPNGSGKSNVVDGIRWVLGEQSIKTLRGGKMEDVIFAGSSDRKSVGMAQVVMTIDNQDGSFPSEYSEISVTRRLYRSGESEYLINKAPCRLRDIHELFMDTGLGRDGFSIIGQGKIEEMLTLKAEERRGLIEEAAGIVKYKYKKRDAERKLAGTEENLVRLDDILVELQERVGPLAEQAARAKEYQSYKAERDALEISLALLGLDRAYGEKHQLDQRMAALTDEQVATEVAIHALEGEMAADKLQLQQATEAYHEQQQMYYQLRSSIAKGQNDEALISEREAHTKSLLASADGEMAALRQEEVTLGQVVDQIIAEEDAFVVALAQAKVQQEAAYQAVSQQEQERTAYNEQLDQLRERQFALLQSQAKVNNEITRLGQVLQGFAAQSRRHSERSEKISEEKRNQETLLAQTLTEQNRLDTERHLVQERLQDVQQAVTSHSQQLEASNKKLAAYTSQVAGEKSRLATLTELEASGEGYYGGVKAILAEKKQGRLSGIVGTVAQLVRVPAAYELAIETALGAGLQHIVTADDVAAQKAIAYLKAERKGRATFLPINTVAGSVSKDAFPDEEVLGLAVDLVAFDEPYRGVMNHLLGRIWVIRDLAAAVRIGKRTRFKHRLVTLEGDLVNPGGVLSGGAASGKKSSLLSRRRELSQLEEYIGRLAQAIAAQEAVGTDLRTSITQGEELRKRLAEELQDMLVSQSALRHQVEHYQGELVRLAKEEALEALDADGLQVEESESRQALVHYTAEHAQLESGHAEMEATLAQVGQQLTLLQQTIASSQATYQTESVAVAKLEQQVAAHQVRHHEIQRRLDEISQRLLEKVEQTVAHQARLLGLDEERRILAEALAAAQAEIGEAEQRQAELRRSQSDLEDCYRGQERDLKNRQKAAAELLNQKHQDEMKLAKLLIQIENGEALLAENHGISYEQGLAYKVEISDEAASRRQMGQLKQKIAALGDINFTAAQEHQEVSERLDFLESQLVDLLEAKASLNKVIKEMEVIMAERFKETYHTVNELFSSVFEAMFGGGKARLELSMPNNYLETGIEIIAQPPGKSEKILTLLSGGERAMTAIALLFALLSVKPSPFCFFDEIEAALDDVNVDRFSRFIQEYTAKTQFILISHRKGTMEAADMLYGVTMENNGVSRVLSVELS